MGNYILRRFLVIIPLLVVISVISFIVVQLPPGSYVETYIQNLKNQGYQPDEKEIERLQSRYGLNQPAYIQYFTWMKNMIFEGDMGRSFVYKQPVSEIIAERAPMTIMISMMAMLLQWIVAVPIGIFSARYQYSIFDYIVTFFGFIGLALPNFLFALVLMYFVYVHTGWAVVGIFSPEFVDASWSFAKLLDMMKNLWIPLVVIATAGTAGLIRTLRGTLLDELKKQYVTTARAKGMKERKLILKYPVRVAINPLISTIGWMLPAIVGGEVVVSQVLNLKTLGPVLLGSVKSEDMYLAGGIIMILSSLTVIGTLLSDILLAWVDPKVRYK
ncbi:peptide/nickel transport system permease protein [Halanaerobium saccharolyticum]|uniref:Peptide/nickel transport system permease protein n=1 Tax=Halanaerobium saccharolyticum TaxID=43595 RepID=A0A4R6M369_9FIRM|nr:ABC transporter permease [Halanaerobium saccharolyticum]TDO94329.1 peptide/nickel transport system permease protein [Halanaerobium saccharolyticum]